MSKVMIEMEMPKSCLYCRFCLILDDPDSNGKLFWCCAGQYEAKGKRKRDKYCPLKECE